MQVSVHQKVELVRRDGHGYAKLPERSSSELHSMPSPAPLESRHRMATNRTTLAAGMVSRTCLTSYTAVSRYLSYHSRYIETPESSTGSPAGPKRSGPLTRNRTAGLRWLQQTVQQTVESL